MSSFIDDKLKPQFTHPCAFGKVPNEHGSCLDGKASDMLISSHNEAYPDRQVEKDWAPRKIQRHMARSVPFCADDTNAERCVARALGLARHMEQYFKPDKEWERRGWLYDTDIRRVLQQVDRATKGVRMMGAFPIDFETLGPTKPNGRTNPWYERCLPLRLKNRDEGTLDPKECIERGNTKLGYVINTGKWHSGGSHWVCMLVDLEQKKAMFYDSTYHRPSKAIRRYVKHLGEAMNTTIEIIRNNKKNQYGRVECGMYCLYMLSGLALGYDFHDLVSQAPRDRGMHELRNAYFRRPHYSVKGGSDRNQTKGMMAGGIGSGGDYIYVLQYPRLKFHIF